MTRRVRTAGTTGNVRSFNLLATRNDTRELALNRCCRCSYEWRDLPFGHARHDTCPKCGSVYWQWLDQESRK
jgi:DNA-directed RNA polymerase subunit M/transcription elongation factor TFIIS